VLVIDGADLGQIILKETSWQTQISLPRPKPKQGAAARLVTKSYDRLDDYPDVTPKFLSSNRKAIRVFVSVGEGGISRSILESF